MRFSLIICTYMRPFQLLQLLESVRIQSVYPDEILIVDGSTDEATAGMLSENHFANLIYHKVSEKDRGLTRQRNFGIAHASAQSEILCFLDDDTILLGDYFKNLIGTYKTHPGAVAVGGYIVNEANWQPVGENYVPRISEFVYDGWKRAESSRFILRKKLGLDADVAPAMAPEFSNGRSVAFLPPSGKTYRAEHLMGGVASYRKTVFDKVRFSTFFEGYGLYEDADFCYRLLDLGNLYVNTSARLEHHHAASGRPNQYRYGKMVVRNGYYIWRVRTPRPSFRAVLKWHAIVLLLCGIRFTNVIFGKRDRFKALTESAGRFSAYIRLFFAKPKRID